ncbi:hypothetical protein JYK22_21695, partial [Nonomuraea sp. RK-328]|nr:hypothetical protein [Nonomuraea sp. RK-328]
VTDWIPVATAARRLGLTIDELTELVAEGPLRGRLIGDHYSIDVDSVTDYERERPKPSVGGGPYLPDHIEDEYRLSKEDR